MSYAQVWIDGTEVTNVAIEGSSTRRLNAPSVAQVKLPMDAAIGGCGSLLKVAFDGTLHFHGRVLLCETEAAEDFGYTVYNATDPLELWKWRPVRQDTADNQGKFGNFSYPTIVKDNIYGPEIIRAMIDGSEGTDGDGSGVPPVFAEGKLFLLKGGFEAGGTDLRGAPTDFPMRMSELASLLVSTGELDIVITPIELDGNGNYGQIDVFNGDYGNILTPTVTFDYGMGDFNIRHLRWNCDMTNMTNKLEYLIGPRKNEGHWRASITGLDPLNQWWGLCLDKFGNPLEDIRTNVLSLMGDSLTPGTSQYDYGVRMDLQEFDGRGDESMDAQCLFRMRWLMEAYLRLAPQQMLHLTPTRDTAIGSFDIGDVVGVSVAAAVNGGFTDYAQRVFEYTIGWGSDSVPAIEELVTSAQSEGI